MCLNPSGFNVINVKMATVAIPDHFKASIIYTASP